MKNVKVFDSIGLMSFAAVISWVLFVIALAWSIMAYNYSKVPRDITIAESAEALVVMGIVVSVIPFMLASIFTYRLVELCARRKN